MNKNVIYILLAALIMAQVFSAARISDLQNQLNNARSEIDYVRSNTANQISSIYENVDGMLKQEASLVEAASTAIGALDIKSLTAPISFSITPKEVGENTAVILNLDGELIAMDKNGTTFTATIYRDIFSSVLPMIVIDENGIKKTTQDDRIMIHSMKDALLPFMHPQLAGEARYGGGTYESKKTLHADVKKAESGVAFTQIRYIITVDGKLFSDEIIPADMLAGGWQAKKNIPLSDGQTCVMSIIATDSIGLEHHYTVDHFVGGANAQREPWFDNEKIYSADGRLLWPDEQ